jgi:hypothetical protein
MFDFLSKGKMDILVPKTNFTHNELIDGKVSLELKKPQKAKGVFIEFLGLRHRKETRRVNRGGKTVTETVTHTDVLFSSSLTLEGEKEYPANQKIEYPFQFTVPEIVESKPNYGEGTLGTVMNIVQQFGPKPGPIEWYLKAKLDVSGFDVNKDLRLFIS